MGLVHHGNKDATQPDQGKIININLGSQKKKKVVHRILEYGLYYFIPDGQLGEETGA